ncbi:response regulator transcription factor [Halovulum dunhuangense]|uniref:Response regulator transcription factor n=1 Tax=Halovulum dunhuangense TaxID=1505036 RepID=A0A849L1S0_9RHOB|nr:response regulator transcription factor [Halovulum dunhuangense]NNU80205.1 response regulator transcription factor [Halovulum dunhuangense]
MRLLIVEDDAETARYLTEGLREEGHVCDHCHTGTAGLAAALGQDYDAIIIDRMLPELDGLSVVRTLRAEGRKTPVLVLSALGQVDDRVKGLRAGSDDYLSKPFAFSELLARLDALTRRAVPSEQGETVLRVGDLELDLLARTARRAGREITLLPREYRILEYFMRRPGRVVTRTMLLEGVWDYNFDPQTNVIDVHVSRLRQKIDKGFDAPLLHTVRGAGYMLRAGGS